MKVLILFVLAMLGSSALPRVRWQLEKPWVFVLICVIVALSFLSLKVSG